MGFSSFFFILQPVRRSLKSCAMVFGVAALFGAGLSGCLGDLGVAGGASALQSQFSGISGATILSPTAVQLTWALSSAYSSYNVYISTQDAPLVTKLIFNSYTVSGLNAGTNYFFSVSGVKSDGSQDGLSTQLAVQTWSAFTGPTSAAAVDANDIKLNWNYQNGPTYQIFYKSAALGSAVPTFTSSDILGQPNVTSQSATGTTIGGLLPNMIYSFAVTAKYADGTSSVITQSSSSSVTAAPLSLGSLASLPTVTATATVAATSYENFTASNAASSYVTTMFTGSLANANSCPTVPSSQVVASITGNGSGNARSLLSAGSYVFSVQVRDSSTGFCGYESLPTVTVLGTLSSTIQSVSATTPSAISPLPIVTANAVQLGGLPTFTVAGALGAYLTQILYNGTVIASRSGNGTMQTLSTNTLPRGSVTVTPVVSYSGESATLAPLTILIKGIDSGPISGPSIINGGSTNAPAFGATLVVGDFNCDGYPDLAVSAPLGTFGPPASFNNNGDYRQGAVAVYYGTSSGLNFSASPSAHPAGTNPLLIASPSLTQWWGGDRFGMSMAVGNFNNASVSGKPCSDLVVGSQTSSGFYVYYGSSAGLQVTSPATKNSLGCNSSGTCDASNFSIIGTTDQDPNIATSGVGPIAVAAGDFNGDGYDDIALGYANHTDTSPPGAFTTKIGEVFLYYGSAYGVSPNYVKFFPPASLINGNNTLFGQSLAFGNVQYKSNAVCSGHCKDLIIGVPGLVGTSSGGGAVVVTGNSTGVTVDGTSHLSGGYFNILPSQCTVSTGCGFSLATADLNEDGYDDIIMGIPFYTPPSPYNYSSAGGFFVFYGNPSGPPNGTSGTGTTPSTPTTTAACTIAQNGSSCSPQLFYRTTDSIASLDMGFSLAGVGDTDGDGYPEITIGAPGYGGTGKGGTYTYYGSSRGITSSTATLAYLNPLSNSFFGLGLAGAKFSSATFSTQFPSSTTLIPQFHDLVMGAPGEALVAGGNPGQGQVAVFTNSGSGLGSSLGTASAVAPAISSQTFTMNERSDLARIVGDPLFTVHCANHWRIAEVKDLHLGDGDLFNIASTLEKQ
jgi:hypothetical protein